MRDVLALPDGGRWMALETSDDGMAAQQATETAIGHFFRSELRRREDGLEQMEYYVLLDQYGGMPVCLRVGTKAGETLVTGFRNGDPYPTHADAIAALGFHLGCTLAKAYPYGPNATASYPKP